VYIHIAAFGTTQRQIAATLRSLAKTLNFVSPLELKLRMALCQSMLPKHFT